MCSDPIDSSISLSGGGRLTPGMFFRRRLGLM
jgi:hypothetical protein